MSQSTFTEAWLSGYDGHQFYTRTYPAHAPTAVILFVHGFADHISRHEHIHAKWPARGVTVFAYDMRGFGRTALDAQHRSADSAYGKTNRDWELRDVEWWARRLTNEYRGVPLFLMGYSAGGGLALVFATRTGPPLSEDAISMFSGVIGSSPLVLLTYQPLELVSIIGRALGKIMPYKSIPAPMPEDRFSRDPAAKELLLKDPLRKPEGTLRGLGDMITQGEKMLEDDWKYWPKKLPLLITFGSEDQVNSSRAGFEFYNKLTIEDKRFSIYEDAYHDLFNEIDDIPERVFEEYASWIEAHLPSVESV